MTSGAGNPSLSQTKSKLTHLCDPIHLHAQTRPRSPLALPPWRAASPSIAPAPSFIHRMHDAAGGPGRTTDERVRVHRASLEPLSLSRRPSGVEVIPSQNWFHPPLVSTPVRGNALRGHSYHNARSPNRGDDGGGGIQRNADKEGAGRRGVARAPAQKR